MRAGGIWLFGEPEEENVMDSKEKVLDRFMRDQHNKVASLYNSGYKAGYEAGVMEGYTKGYTEALEAYAEPEEEPIKVGDEVIDPNGLKAIVTNTDTHFHLYYPQNGKTWKAPKTTVLTKTGERFDLGFPE